MIETTAELKVAEAVFFLFFDNFVSGTIMRHIRISSSQVGWRSRRMVNGITIAKLLDMTTWATTDRKVWLLHSLAVEVLLRHGKGKLDSTISAGDNDELPGGGMHYEGMHLKVCKIKVCKARYSF